MPKSRNPKIEFDRLQMYFGEPFVIDVPECEGVITLYQPTIGDVMRMGENKFYSTLNIFITNTTSYRSFLWDIGIDWNELSDFELFTMLYKGADKDVVNLMFHDLDLQKFEPFKKTLEDKETIVLYDAEDKIEINEVVYWHISQYLREVFNMNPEEKLTSDNVLKQWFIDKDKRQQNIDKEKAEKGKEKSNTILPIISACVNHPGFKYNTEELKNVGVCQFYDSVKRLQIYEQTNAILKGMYSGLALGGAKDLKPDDYNFMREK